MILSILILALSGGLFVYWARYTIRMILDSTFVEENSRRVVNLVQLNFPGVQAELERSRQGESLDSLYRDLRADYDLLMNLIPASRALISDDHKLATWMFELNRYRYKLCSKLFGGRNCACQRDALGDMAAMVRHLSSAIGSASA